MIADKTPAKLSRTGLGYVSIQRVDIWIRRKGEKRKRTIPLEG